MLLFYRVSSRHVFTSAVLQQQQNNKNIIIISD